MFWALSDWWTTLREWAIILRDWLEQHSRWIELASLGNSNLVKTAVLMPAFGYMLLLNDNVHQYITIKYDGWLLHFLPSTWRIWLLFYGSFFLSIATLLFSYFCHPDFKRCATPYQKSESESEHVLRMGGLPGVADELRQEYARLSEREEQIFTLKAFEPALTGDDVARLKTISKCLIYRYLIRSVRRPGLRLFIYLLFRIGLILIAIPAIFTFLQVSAIAAKRILL
ncbi:hypothetical protein GGD63_000530 [Bradyrhizobium sp. cir1]|uniref:hypothetical protein n=1 Tax=Bradyrhizobium sp. cir1 TaxID=1445730 RepID=UPI0016068E9B|nr:hypothetical protein [Bradyrhizobium sp. cir1]MBB4367761.1 hypothetical protein [Bradyrhizobium sp. cir1]